MLGLAAATFWVYKIGWGAIGRSKVELYVKYVRAKNDTVFRFLVSPCSCIDNVSLL